MHGSSELLASRLRQVRLEKFGNDGTAALAEAMKIPARTWNNFEEGVAMPGLVILQFIDITGVDPHWLLTGEGERYLVSRRKSALGASR